MPNQKELGGNTVCGCGIGISMGHVRSTSLGERVRGGLCSASGLRSEGHGLGVATWLRPGKRLEKTGKTCG